MEFSNSTKTTDIDFELRDDLELLEQLIRDAKTQAPIYKPGPYWEVKTKIIENEIRRCGLSEFRGSSNFVGFSYADNQYLDYRQLQNFGLRRVTKWILNIFPFKKIYEGQLRWTESYAKQSLSYAESMLDGDTKTLQLLKNYHMPYSLLGACARKIDIDGTDYSLHYLDLVSRHDDIVSSIPFESVNSLFEIGGGFGSHIHFLLENYDSIRKVLYLDIPPNLYVGTRYLKAFYGAQVLDYSSLKSRGSIRFSKNDKREIYCIAPWQIEDFSGEIDLFMNTSSFVEMPKKVVTNYVNKLNEMPESRMTAIVLSSYKPFDKNTTFDPMDLLDYFPGRDFASFEYRSLLDSSKSNIYLVSPGKFANDRTTLD